MMKLLKVLSKSNKRSSKGRTNLKARYVLGDILLDSTIENKSF